MKPNIEICRKCKFCGTMEGKITFEPNDKSTAFPDGIIPHLNFKSFNICMLSSPYIGKQLSPVHMNLNSYSFLADIFQIPEDCPYQLEHTLSQEPK